MLGFLVCCKLHRTAVKDFVRRERQEVLNIADKGKIRPFCLLE